MEVQPSDPGAQSMFPCSLVHAEVLDEWVGLCPGCKQEMEVIL